MVVETQRKTLYTPDPETSMLSLDLGFLGWTEVKYKNFLWSGESQFRNRTGQVLKAKEEEDLLAYYMHIVQKPAYAMV